MRILHVVRQFAPGIGGMENYVAELARAQGEAGHPTTVLTLDRVFSAPGTRLPHAERTTAFGIQRIPYFGSYKYPVAPSVLRHVRDCDVVHVHGVDFFFDALAWTRLWHGKPLVATTHGGFFHTPYAARLKKLFFNTVTRSSIRSYGAVVACSENDRDVFQRIFPRPVDLVENGVDTEKFANRASPVFRKHIISIGRFATHKRLDHLIDFLAEVKAKDPQWTLTLAGVEWDMKVSDLARYAASRGLASSVSFRTGLSNAGLAAEIERASFVASASEYEGFGIAVVEGMSAGLIPLLSDIPAFRRLQESASVGQLLDFAEPRKAARQFLAATALFAADYPLQRARARQAARHYAWPAVARKIDGIYERVIGEHQRDIFGVPVLVSTCDDAIRKLDEEVDAGHTTKVAFLNAHTANIARSDPKFSNVLHDSLVLNDGIGVDIASYWLYGRRFPENLNGTDFTVEYLKRTHRSYNIYLLGARRRVVTQAAVRLAAKFRRHRIVGYYDGYFDASETPQIIENIRKSGADLLLVGFGNPKQEIWIAENLEKTGCRLGFGVGALFDFTSGSTPRAPRWIRSCRAEWVYRLFREPGRLWRRYLVGNASFLYRLITERSGGAPTFGAGGR